MYQDDKLYNGSRYKVYQASKSMTDYLESEGKPKPYVKTVYYKALGESIILEGSIKDFDRYTYGSITHNDKIFYFFVTSITTDSNNRTKIDFIIDWWSTNWNYINCTKAHITRQNIWKPLYMEQPISNRNMKLELTNLENYKDFVIMATYIPSGEQIKSFISYIILEGNNYNISLVEQGYWYKEFGIPGADIKDCFIVPMFGINLFEATRNFYFVNTGEETEGSLDDKVIKQLAKRFGGSLYYPKAGDYGYDGYTGKYMEFYVDTDMIRPREIDEPKDYTIGNFYAKVEEDEHYTETLITFKMYHINKSSIEGRTISQEIDFNMSSTEILRQGICDWNGNLIWECPVDKSVTSFETRLLLGLSHVMLEFIPTNVGMNNIDNSQMIVGKSFCYDCRHPGLFVDSYQDYVLKNRDYDIAMRKIQSEKQEIQAWASTAENIGFGAAFGQTQGAVAAGIGGVIEAISTHFINSTYDPQIQNQYNLLYSRMSDQISLIGDSITEVLWHIKEGKSLIKKYSISPIQESINRYTDDITINGYYTDEMTEFLSHRFGDNVIIQADNIVVEGACNLETKHQVVNRLMNGVEFI